jgi:enoyl reductase-like protein
LSEVGGPTLVRYKHHLSNMYICFNKKGAVKAVVSTYRPTYRIKQNKIYLQLEILKGGGHEIFERRFFS